MAEKKWKIGMIGAGGISEAHLEATKDEARAEVVAIADVSQELAAYRAARHQIPLVFTDYKELLGLSELDAVILCLPNYLHYGAAIEALKAGKHILCEKPMALSAAQAEEMIAAARKAEKILMVGQNNRFRGDSLYAKRLLEEGKLGQVYLAKTGWVRRYGIPGWGSWFTQKELAGGGPLIDIGVHMLDLTLWLLGYPKPVTVLGKTYAAFGPRKKGLSEWGRADENGRFDVEDLAIAMITFENGASMTLEASWASHIEKENVFLELYGTEGGTYFQLLEDRFTLYHEINDVPAATTILPPKENERVLLFHNFIDALEGTAEPVCTPEHALYINRLIDAIYLSAKTGEAVKL